jgi:hypothetical protein
MGGIFISEMRRQNVSNSTDPVMQAVCDERHKVEDERFARDKERLDGVEKAQQELINVSTKLTQMIEYQQEQVKDHNNRLSDIEKRPGSWLDTIKSAIIAAVIGIIAGLFTAHLG